MRALVLLALVSSAAAAGGYLRAFHASPDAPAVNVVVNNATAIPNLVYGSASGFLAVPAARYEVRIVPASAPGTTVLAGTISVPEDTAVTAVARGYLATIGLDLFYAPVNGGPSSGCSIRVAHLSPDAPAVNVVLNGSPALRNVSFPEFAPGVGHLGLTQGSYQVAVDVASSGTTVLSTRYTRNDRIEQTIAVVGLVSGGSTPLKFAVLDDNIRRSVPRA